MTERVRHSVSDPYRAVYDVGSTLAASLDLDEVLASVARRVAEALDVQQCDIHDYNADADTLTCAAIWSKDPNEEDAAWIGHVIDLNERPGRREVLDTKAPVEAYADDEHLLPEERAIMVEWHELATMEVPLLYGDEIIGVLGVCDMERMRRYTADEIRLLELLAGPAAVAIHNARAFRDRAERTKRLGAVVDASRAITSSIDLDEVLQRVAQQATEVMGVSQGAIYEYRPEADSLVYRAVHVLYTAPDSPDDDPVGTLYRLDDYPTDGEILRDREIVVEHLSDEALPADRRLTMDAWNEKTVLSLPLVFRREPIGILRLYDMVEERPFGPEDIDLVRSIGDLAGAALHNARLYREHADHRARLLGLLETSQVLTSTFELDALVNGVAAGVAQLLGDELGTEVWLRADDGSLVPAPVLLDEAQDDAPAALPSPLALAAIERLRPTHESTTGGSSLAVPFVSRGSAEGFVEMSLPGFRSFAQPEIEALQVLANQAAVAFANAALYRQVQRQAVRDGLTGLYNHRHFQERLAEEVRARSALRASAVAAHARRRRLQAVQRRARPPARRRGAARGRRDPRRRTCVRASTSRRATAARSSP